MKTYREHYYSCQEAYDPKQSESPNVKVYTLALVLDFLEHTDEYNKLVENFSKKSIQKFENPETKKR